MASKYNYHLAKTYCQEAADLFEQAEDRLQAAAALFERDERQETRLADDLGEQAKNLKYEAATLGKL